jgi:DNA repair protein SbcC/Rad50
MIEAIELRNWKTHGHTTLDFSRGTNVLLGSMGSGKSTIMDAISFALFGTYPAVTHGRVKVGEIITNRPEQKSSASVKLRFRVDDDLYEVERNLDLNKPTKATLAKNGAYLQSQPEQVNSEIERILKIDYDLFSRAVYSEQNRLTSFLELTPAKRKGQMDELLGLDKFATAQENAGTLISRIKDMAAEKERTLANFDAKKTREQYESLLGEAEALGKGIEKLDAELKKVEKEKASAEKGLNEAKGLFVKKTDLIREMAGLRSKAAVIGEEIDKMRKAGVRDKAEVAKALVGAKSEFDALKKAEEEAEKRKTAAVRDLARLEAEIGSAEKETGERDGLRKELVGADRKKIEDTVKSGAENLRQVRGECEANAAAKKENDKWLKELENHFGKCPVCERDLDKDVRDRIIGERKGASRKLEERIIGQSREAEALEKALEKGQAELQKIKGIEEMLERYREIDGRLKEAKDRLVKAQAESATLSKRKDDASAAVAKANESMMRLRLEKETLERMERHLLDMEAASASLAAKEKELGKLDITHEAIDRLQDSFTAMSSRTGELRTRLDADAKSEKEKLAQAREKEKEVAMLERMQREVTVNRKAVENITKFRNALEETQTALRSKLIGSINDIMQEIWPELYPYGDYQGIMLEPTSDDYVLKVRTGGGPAQRWEEVSTVASGGEKSIACLTMRVAFALVLVPNLKWIILDEPTHNIDQQGLGRFIRAISEVMPRIVDQVFIITHDETLKQVANARVYTLSRDKEADGKTSVEAS